MVQYRTENQWLHIYALMGQVQFVVHCLAAQLYFQFRCACNLIRIRWDPWIRIQEDKNDPEK